MTFGAHRPCCTPMHCDAQRDAMMIKVGTICQRGRVCKSSSLSSWPSYMIDMIANRQAWRHPSTTWPFGVTKTDQLTNRNLCRKTLQEVSVNFLSFPSTCFCPDIRTSKSLPAATGLKATGLKAAAGQAGASAELDGVSAAMRRFTRKDTSTVTQLRPTKDFSCCSWGARTSRILA